LYRRRAIIVLLLLAVPALLAAGGAFGSGRNATPTPTPAPITIGALFSQTGSGNVYGPQQLKAAQLAVGQINAAGGISGAPLRLVAIDDESEAAPAIAALRTLIGKDGAIAVLGPSLSQIAYSVDPVADRLQTPVVGVSNTADGIVGDCKYPCTWIWRDSLGAAVAIPDNISEYVLEHHPFSAAITYKKGDVLGVQEAAIARQTFVENGVNVAAYVATPANSSGVAGIAEALAAKPDVLFVAGAGAHPAESIRQARAHGFKGGILGGNTLNSAVTTALAREAGAGAQSAAAWYPGNDFPANANFITSYRQAFRSAPDQFAAQAFVGVQIIAGALAAAKLGPSTDPIAVKRAKLQRALGGVALTSALGPFRFTTTHDVSQIVWVQAMNGRGGHSLIGFCNTGGC
jgi:branched-chain amino acid transport system substrate-binding protein